MADPKGSVSSNPQNSTRGHIPRMYSTFDKSLSYRLINTHRFGEYMPTFVMDGVPQDKIRLNSVDRYDSLSLNAPFKGTIRKTKSTFMVPLMALLPFNWDLIYVQPSNGDDVPDDANCVIVNFMQSFNSLWSSAWSTLKSNIPNVVSGSAAPSAVEYGNFLTAVLRTLVLGEYVYSHGCLLNVLGYKTGSRFRATQPVSDAVLDGVSNGFDFSYDALYDAVFSAITDPRIFADGATLTLYVPRGNGGSAASYVIPVGQGALRSSSSIDSDLHQADIPLRFVLETFRENPLSYVVVSGMTSSSVAWTSARSIINYYLTASIALPSVSPIVETPGVGSNNDITALNPSALNLSRVLAYQMACWHFYSNSSIDFIYTAELFRSYISSFVAAQVTPFSGSTLSNANRLFTWNGRSLPYDWLSGHILNFGFFYENLSSSPVVINVVYSQLYATSSFVGLNRSLSLFAAIFSYRKSLRYADYFVGSRPRPLAPINTDVSVNNNMVSVIDITRNIQAQRFANAVMRSRQKIEDYVKLTTGRAPAPDYHNPFYLSDESQVIFGDDVQNTSTAQQTDANSRTANFASSPSPYVYTFHNDDNHPCVYLQIVSYDVRRAYSRTIERQFMHINRYDMFNPSFQFIGDQPVYAMELGYIPAGQTPPSIFSYQTRDIEYKERYDQVSGGAVENLPGWFITDRDQAAFGGQNFVLNPDFIRSHSFEFDRYFLSLTGYSLGSYFHFIVDTQNNVSAKRQMAVDPQILQ